MSSIPLRVGSVHGWLLDCGSFPYDAGVIFGAVPRVSWGPRFATDARNCLQVGLRPLLIEGADGWTLVDTAMPADTVEDAERLIPVATAMAAVGVAPEAVTAVVLTHLHPDHVGGDFVTSGSGEPAFPRARYYVQREEAAAAAFPNERTRADYDRTHVRRLERAGVLRTVAGTYRLNDAVSLVLAAGHTPGHQCVLVADAGEAALFVSDLAIIPVQAERLTWISALDTHPMVSLESKRYWLGRAVEHGWRLLFTHEADETQVVGRLVTADKRWRFVPEPGE